MLRISYPVNLMGDGLVWDVVECLRFSVFFFWFLIHITMNLMVCAKCGRVGAAAGAADDDQMIRRWMLLGWLKRDPSAVIGEDENLIKQNTNILNAFLCTWHWLNVVHKLTAWYIMPANIHFKLVKCLYFDDIWDSFLYYKNPPWI